MENSFREMTFDGTAGSGKGLLNDRDGKNASGNGLIEEAWSRGKEFVKENAVEIAAGVALGGLILLSRGRNWKMPETRPGSNGRLQGGDAAPVPGLVKDSSGGLVPRPELVEGSLKGSSEFALLMKEAPVAYEKNLQLLSGQPWIIKAGTGDEWSMAKVAERVLADRVKVTGGKVTPEAVAKETAEISRLSGITEIPQLAGTNPLYLTIMNKERFTQIAVDTSFRHVPPIGQFLKAAGGASQNSIDDALKAQAVLPAGHPRRLLGEVLVDRGVIKQADVDLAMARQTELKKALASIRDEFIKRTYGSGM